MEKKQIQLADIKQKAREMFDEKFELESQGCSECGGFELIDKTEIRFPRGKYYCEYDLDKIKSFIDQIIDLAIAERDKEWKHQLGSMVENHAGKINEIIEWINSKKDQLL